MVAKGLSQGYRSSVDGDFVSPNPHFWRYTDSAVETYFHKNDNFAYNISNPNAKDTWSSYTNEGSYRYNNSFVDETTYKSFLEQQALGRLLDSLRGSNEIVVDIAEWGQTKALFGSYKKATGVLGNLTADLLSRRYRSTLRAASAAYLAVRYGVNPLISTVFQTAELLLDRIDVQVYAVEGRALRESSSWTSYNVAEGPPCSVSRPVRVFVETSHRVQCKALYTVKSRTFDIAAGLSSFNPAAIAWELLPGSFIFDWFVGVGDYLRLVENMLLYQSNLVGGYTTNTFRRHQSEALQYEGTCYGGSSSARYTRNDKSRTIYKFKSRVLGLPWASVTHPRFNFSLGKDNIRALDAVALLTTRVIHGDRRRARNAFEEVTGKYYTRDSTGRYSFS